MFCRECYSCVLRECSVCVLQGQLSLCSAWSALHVFIVELSVSNLQMLAREELLNLENFVRLFERSACPLSYSSRVAQIKRNSRFIRFLSFLEGDNE